MNITDSTAVSPRSDDPAFPGLHVRPASGWVNDPNGPIRWRGRCHVFFQHNPAAPLHAGICWGHASSDDLASWRIEPVALAPTPGGPDAGGCWSGCAVDDGGVATAVYTGVTGDPMTATVCLAYAQDDDLRIWTKNPTPVAAPPDGMDLIGYRDPFVLTHGGSRYALVGAGLAGGAAATALLYACDDLREWTYLGPLLDTSDPVAASVAPADIWECPLLIRLDDRWALIVSLWTGDILGRVAYLVGDLVARGGGLRFQPTGGGLVDHGHDFYAPAVLADGDRALLWGWTWEDRPRDHVMAAGWAGALTLPRALALTADQRLVSTPAPETNRLRSSLTRSVLTPAAGQEGREPLPEGPVDVELVVSSSAAEPMSLRLDRGEEDLRITLHLPDGRAFLERMAHHSSRRAWVTEGRFPPGGADVDIRVVIDGSVIEVYVRDGPVFTERLYPSAPGTWSLTLAGPEQARCQVSVWSLTPTARGRC